MIDFKRKEKKTIPQRYQKLEFQTLKDTTSTPTILPYKKTPGGGGYLNNIFKLKKDQFLLRILGLYEVKKFSQSET